MRALLASFGFHGALLGSVVGVAFLYESKTHLNGSLAGGQAPTLPTLVILSKPPDTPAPAQAQPTLSPPTPAKETTSRTESRLAAKPSPPEAVPVLAAKPSPAEKFAAAPARPTPHPSLAHSSSTEAKHTGARAAAAATPSSYTPGASSLPHPPYPAAARDLRESGTVVMNVRFDPSGNVAGAEVEKSSGVEILDSTTRAFIRTHWHDPAYAGQTVSAPVEYRLEDLPAAAP